MASKGYKFCDISKKKLKDTEFFEEIEAKESNIKKYMETTINEDGMIFGLQKDKKLKAICMLKTTPSNRKELKIYKQVYLDEITEETKDKFEKDLIAVLQEFVALEQFDKIKLNDNEIVPQKISVGKYSIGLGTFCFVAGIITWILLDDIIWFVFGVLFAVSSGIAIQSTATKNEKENTKKKK